MYLEGKSVLHGGTPVISMPNLFAKFSARIAYWLATVRLDVGYPGSIPGPARAFFQLFSIFFSGF